MNNTTTTYNTSISTSIGAFTAQVYGWMTGGLLITAAVSFLTYILAVNNAAFSTWLLTNSWILIVAFVLQLVLVVGLSAAINRLSLPVAIAGFMLYAALLGFTLFTIFAAYTASSIFAAFVVSAGTFCGMSILGFVTKTDLTRWGNLALMGLLGLVIATVVNIFLRSSGLDIFLNYFGVLIFLILIAYDTQKIKHFAAVASQTGQASKMAIIAALELYLDFINLFLRILSIVGKRR